MPARFEKDHNEFAAAFGAIIFVPLDVLNCFLSIPITVFRSKVEVSTLKIVASAVSLPLIIPILAASKLITYVLAMATGSHALEHAKFAAKLVGVGYENEDGLAKSCCVSYEKDFSKPLISETTHIGRVFTSIPGIVALGVGIIIIPAAKAIGNRLSSLKDSAMSKFKSFSADNTIKNPDPTLTAKNLEKSGNKTPTTASITSGSNSPRSSITSKSSDDGGKPTGPK